MIEKYLASARGYSGVAKLLHWLVVALLAVQFALAWTMPHVRRDTRPDGLIAWHVGVGLAVLFIVLVRLLWRLRHPVPLLREAMPPWQYQSAQAAHAALYLVLFVVPVLGWAAASYRGWSLKLFALVPLPGLVPTRSAIGQPLGDIHALVAYGLLGLVGLHVAAALYHRFWLRDRVLARMLPGGAE